MKNKKLWLSLLALILVLAAVAQPALAYFTSNSGADASVPLELGSKTVIKEHVDGLKKEVTIKNTEGNPVWIRAIAYAGQTYTLTVGGSGWTKGSDNWYYYGSPVNEGEETSVLSVEVTAPPTDSEFYVPSFNVSVQYESVPVLFDENGDPDPSNPQDADWEHPLDFGTTTP